MKIPLSKRLQGQGKSLLRRIVDAAPEGAISLGLGQPILPVPPELSQALADAASAPARYSPNAGLPELRESIAKRYGRTPEEVLVTVGAQEALFLAIAGLLDAGDEILVPDPGFPVYQMIAAWCGAEAIRYTLSPSDAFQPSTAQILSLVTPKTRLVVLNTPSNPTGTCHRSWSLKTLLEALETRGIPYLSDEAYADLTYDPTPPILPSALSKNGLIAGSISKSHALMGWRLGWLVAPPEVIKGLIPLHQMTATCASVPSQRAALVALSPLGDQLHLNVREAMRRRRDLTLVLAKALPNIPPTFSDAALYLFLDVKAYLNGDDVALAYELLSDGVIVVPGQAFGPGGRGFIRVAFGSPPDDLREGMRRLHAGLTRLSNI